MPAVGGRAVVITPRRIGSYDIFEFIVKDIGKPVAIKSHEIAAAMAIPHTKDGEDLEVVKLFLKSGADITVDHSYHHVMQVLRWDS